MNRQSKFFYEFGHFHFNPAERQLLHNGEPVPLTSKVFDILRVLVENGGHLLEKDELIKAVWPDSFVEEGNLNRNISTLRKALGDGLDGQEFIETVPKRGYRFVANVRKVEALNDLPATEKQFSQQDFAQKNFPTRSVTAQPDQDVVLSRSGRVVLASPQWFRKSIDSLAVLPLINASADPSAEYLSDGITESIINSLSQLPKLRVVPRSTVFRYKGRDVDPQEVGQTLGVRAVFTGRLLQHGDRLIIKAELIDVANESQLWGEQYNRKLSDIFEVEEEISREISDKLRIKLTGEDKKRLTKRYTESTDAYQAYLKGRFYWNKRTEENGRKGISYFEQAIKTDPKYARAYAGLADSYLLLGSIECGALSPEEALPLAKSSALKALKLDDSLAEAHTSLAYVRVFDWEWEQAEKEYRRAIELNPTYATAHHWYALYLMAMEKPEEALAELKRAEELDPLSLPIKVGFGWHYFLLRQYDRAIEEYRKTLEMDATFAAAHLWIGVCYSQKGFADQALKQAQQVIAFSGGNPFAIGAAALAHAVAGRKDEAQKVLNELNELSKQRYVSPYMMAAIYTALAEHDRAFECLERAYESRSEGMYWLKVDPTLVKLHADSRFADLMRRVGLAV